MGRSLGWSRLVGSFVISWGRQFSAVRRHRRRTAVTVVGVGAGGSGVSAMSVAEAAGVWRRTGDGHRRGGKQAHQQQREQTSGSQAIHRSRPQINRA